MIIVCVRLCVCVYVCVAFTIAVFPFSIRNPACPFAMQRIPKQFHNTHRYIFHILFNLMLVRHTIPSQI